MVKWMPTVTAAPVVYPESDGQPMADNTLQFRWIVTIKEGLEVLFADRPDVFVAGDLLWYPVQGQPKIRRAPDAMVAFGRPKGERGSYLQWQEDDIAPQVAFEVQSPGNTAEELRKKREFYSHHGVEEYYLYDPDGGRLEGWIREGGGLLPIPKMQGWVSPRLGVRFGLEAGDLRLVRPDGSLFLSYVELDRERQRAEQRHRQAEQELQQAEQELRQAEQELRQSEQGLRQAEQGRRQAEERAARLEARLRELGVDPG